MQSGFRKQAAALKDTPQSQRICATLLERMSFDLSCWPRARIDPMQQATWQTRASALLPGSMQNGQGGGADTLQQLLSLLLA